MSSYVNITNTDFNQTLQNIWLKSVLCSKLVGGLANSLIDFNVDVPPLQYNYDEIKAMLHERILRNSDCVKQKASYVSMPDRMRSLDNMYDQDRRERDLYFYHSDHLGSSSFITDADGITTQHLQYLPYGELFVEQRSTANYFTPYKFSAKEKDEETSYSYFGARYLASDFSFWLSVDPLADKYPNISPYAYCNLNPVMLIDPNGMEAGEPDNWEKCSGFGKINFLGAFFRNVGNLIKKTFWYNTKTTTKYDSETETKIDETEWDKKTDKTVTVTSESTITFESYEVEDQLIVNQDGHEVINTGSVGTDGDPIKEPIGPGSYQIIVNPNTNEKQKEENKSTKYDITIQSNDYRVRRREVSRLWGIIPFRIKNTNTKGTGHEMPENQRPNPRISKKKYF